MSDYPGLGLPLRHFNPSNHDMYPMGIHGNCFGSDSSILPVRELAMMIIMDKLTDKTDWHIKVFNDEIIAKWRKEALEYPDVSLWKAAVGGKANPRWGDVNEDSIELANGDFKQLEGIMSIEAFDYCVKELQNKARYFEKSDLIPTLDSCATVVKSDTLLPAEIQAELRAAFDRLKVDQNDSPDFHPNSGDKVQNLLHPSMYPLVYGRSKVVKKEVVGVENSIEKWAGKGEVIIPEDSPHPNAVYGLGRGSVPPNFWSHTYQWLPSNVAFQDDGTVKFTSYINNLHPTKYRDIYGTIERLVQTVIPAWDQCLAFSPNYKEKKGAGSTESRFPIPEHPDDDNPENWDTPEPECNDQHGYEDQWDEWRRTRKPVQPPTPSFSDDDDFYVPDASNLLSKKFKDTGLQVIVKMASIELTPEKPDFPVGGWHVEGQMNEHICATALYYLDSENITSSNLSFRMQTSDDIHEDYEVGQDAYNWLEQIYGTSFSPGSSPCLQNYGSVETKEGRLLAFPNVFHHRVSPFRLTDPTKPGHRRFIALWLVDPHMRIISTANVPPQQLSWWAEAIQTETMSKMPAEITQLLQAKGVNLGSNEAENAKLPPELKNIVHAHFEAEGILLMSEEEAKEHREKLMAERSAFHMEADNQWHEHSYSFCEH